MKINKKNLRKVAKRYIEHEKTYNQGARCFGYLVARSKIIEIENIIKDLDINSEFWEIVKDEKI